MKLDLYRSDVILMILRDTEYSGEWSLMATGLMDRADRIGVDYRVQRRIKQDLNRIKALEMIEGNLEGRLVLMDSDWVILDGGKTDVEFLLAETDRPVNPELDAA